MPCRWHIDDFTPQRIAGWIDDDGPVKTIEIAVNGRCIAAFSPTDYRKDLEDAGFGDGRRSFSFTVSKFLVEPINVVTISDGNQVLYSATLQSTSAGANDAARPSRAATKQDKPDTGLLQGPVRRIQREATGKQMCEFYHVVDLPDGTTTGGQWDLRNNAHQYLGNVDFAEKRVIEIGPASGFLSFHMERQGARVAVIEPPMESFWDLVPQAAANLAETQKVFGAHIERIRNSFWFLHHCYKSDVECYEIDAYRIPPQPTKFDIGVLASVLLHVSSPVRMLESVAALVADEIIIVDRYYPELVDQPICRLVPSAENHSMETWWEFSPRFFEQYLGVLGFHHIAVTRHRQLFASINEECEMFTVVGSR